ncbi:MAG: hypothetical protein WA771_09015 [Chthoniobacterales bacterium]
MSEDRNLGEQPLAAILSTRDLRPQDLVATDPIRITHKMIARATKGRRLTSHSQQLVLSALNTVTGETHKKSDLFNY